MQVDVFLTKDAKTVTLPHQGNTVTLVSVMAQPKGKNKPKAYYAIVEPYDAAKNQPAIGLLHASRGNRLVLEVAPDGENSFAGFGAQVVEIKEEYSYPSSN